MRTYLIVLSVVFSLLACQKDGESKLKEAEKSKNGKSAIVKKVRVEKIVTGDVVKSFLLNGIAESSRDVTIVAQTSGEIIEYNLEIGKEVRKGSLLAVIDPEPKKNALNQAEIALKQATLAFELKDKVYQRDKLLLESKGISAEQFEISESGWKQASLAVEQANSSVLMAKMNYDYSFVKAPFDGMIVSETLSAGQFVGMGVTIARIVDTKSLQVQVGVDYNNLISLKKNLKGVVSIELPDKTVHEGKIKGIADAPDKATSLYPVKISINKTGKLQVYPGTLLKVLLSSEKYETSFEAKRRWLNFQNNIYTIFVAGKGVAEEKEVEMLNDNGENLILRLKNSQLPEFNVVVSGQEALKNGSLIEVLE